MPLLPQATGPAYVIAQPLPTSHGVIYPLVADSLRQLHEFALDLGLAPGDFSTDFTGYPCYILPVGRQPAANARGAITLAAISDTAELKTLKLAHELAEHPEYGRCFARNIIDRASAIEQKKEAAVAAEKARKLSWSRAH